MFSRSLNLLFPFFIKNKIHFYNNNYYHNFFKHNVKALLVNYFLIFDYNVCIGEFTITKILLFRTTPNLLG